MKQKSSRLTLWILLGLLAGVAAGLLQAGLLSTEWNNASIKYFHDPVGKIFLNAIKLMVVPLVLVSLTLGTAAIGDIRRLGRIGGKTVTIYLTTTAIAVTIAFGLAMLIQPGSSISVPTGQTFNQAAMTDIVQVLVNIVPANPLKSLVDGEMLQIIFIAILTGLAITWVGPKADPLVTVLKSADQVVQRMVVLVMYFAPIGVFALMAKLMIGQGTAAFLPLLKYLAAVFGALGIQVFVIYPAYLVLFARVNPWRFYANVYPAMLMAFSTSSSNATLPVSMSVAEERLGAREDVYSFTLPLGATINMDGTAIMQGVATVFIANFYGISLGVGEFLQVVFMATLASIGTAGVPGVGLVMLSMVLMQLGLPIEGIGMILGIDRIVDMARTAVNITGDLMATTIVAQSEGSLDADVFGQPNLAPAGSSARVSAANVASQATASPPPVQS